MNNSTLSPDVPYEQLAKPAPLRTRTGPRLTKAAKKVEKRNRQQAQSMLLLLLAETRRQVRHLLENAERYAWDFCSGGRLVLRLDDGSFLNIYSPAHALNAPSDVISLSKRRIGYVVNGRIGMTRYEERAGGEVVMSQVYRSAGGKLGGPLRACLVETGESITGPGQNLICEAGTIVRQQPAEGTVAIVRYEQVEGFMGRVFWPLGAEYQQDMMAPAEPQEVRAIVAAALANWSDQ